MNPFILNSAVLLYFYIILVVKIIAVTVPLDQAVQVKGIRKHAEKYNIDPLIQDKWKNSIDVTKNENSLNEAEKKKDEPVNLEFLRDRYDLDDGNSNIKEKNIFKDEYMIQKNFLQAKDPNDIYDNNYTLQLHEKNFRWSLPVQLGTSKKPINLVISTNSPYTVLYCSFGPPGTGPEDSPKYDITVSKELIVNTCASKKCGKLGLSDNCLPLQTFLDQLSRFTIKKKICTNRFCDHLTSSNFLSMFGPFDNKQSSTCGFTTTIGKKEVKGFFFQDDFYIKSRIQNWYPYFGCITSNEDLKLSDDTYGVAGFREYDDITKKSFESLQGNYILQSKSLAAVYGLCFKEGGGFVSFGGVHPGSLELLPEAERGTLGNSKHIYKILWINWVDREKKVCELNVEKILLKKKDNSTLIDIEFKKHMVVDSYEYAIYLPENVSTQIKSKISDHCKLESTNECNGISADGKLKLVKGDIKDFPKLEFTFKEGTVVIEPQDYIVKIESGYYRILIGSSDTNVLGIPFFLHKYLIFDNRLRRIGVSKSDCSLVVDNNDYSGILDLFGNLADSPLPEEEETNSIRQFFEQHKTALIGAGGFAALAATVLVIKKYVI